MQSTEKKSGLKILISVFLGLLAVAAVVGSNPQMRAEFLGLFEKPSETVSKTLTNFKNAKSFKVNYDLAVNVKDELSDTAIDVKVKGDANVKDHFKAVKGKFEAGFGGLSLNFDLILLKEDFFFKNQLFTQQKWAHLDLKKGLAQKDSKKEKADHWKQALKIFEAINMPSLKKTGEEKINGKKAEKYEVDFDTKKLMSALKMDSKNTSPMQYDLKNAKTHLSLWIEKGQHRLVQLQLTANKIRYSETSTNAYMGSASIVATTKYSDFDSDFKIREPENVMELPDFSRGMPYGGNSGTGTYLN